MFKQLFKPKSSSTSRLVHNDYFNTLRAKEYNRLDTHGHVYLDYTGGNLYAASQLKKHQELLSKNVFGNPTLPILPPSLRLHWSKKPAKK
ncbi:hypothetical protein [Gangjinia marincola]|uniref:hypothetical protein n=1 Tax=Gangjinia marincola TaxID=578463 RepID=UPI0031D3F067